MPVVADKDEPSVQELLQATRQLTGRAYRLTMDIDAVINDLTEFSAERDIVIAERRNSSPAPYDGVERRHSG